MKIVVDMYVLTYEVAPSVTDWDGYSLYLLTTN